MKTKFIALALAAITLCMALTGCMHTDIGIKMNKDETGSISATFGIEKTSTKKSGIPVTIPSRERPP